MRPGVFQSGALYSGLAARIRRKTLHSTLQPEKTNDQPEIVQPEMTKAAPSIIEGTRLRECFTAAKLADWKPYCSLGQRKTEPLGVPAVGDLAYRCCTVSFDFATSFPVAVEATFSQNWPGFAGLPAAHRYKLASLACSCIRNKRYRHSQDASAIFYPYAVRDSDFGRGEFQRINQRLGMFDVSDCWKKGKFTKTYRLADKLIAIVEELELSKTTLVDHNGRRLKTPAKEAIQQRDTGGNNRTGQGNLSAVISVDIDALLALRTEAEQWRWYLKDGYPKPTTRILQKRLEELPDNTARRNWISDYALIGLTLAIMHCDTDYLPRGKTEIRYFEYPSGRLYSVGPSLQNDFRELRKVALSGHWDYDVENCHYSLCRQLAHRIGIETPAIDHYLAHKSEVRNDLASITGSPVRGIKQCLLALIYGARTGLSKQQAIVETIGIDAAGVLFKQPAFANLAAEVKTIRQPIIDSMPQHRGKIVNPFGKTAPADCKTPEQALAFVVQGAEAACLHSVIRRHGADLRLLQHDGWTSAVRLDTAQLEAEITEDTGFSVKIEEAAL